MFHDFKSVKIYPDSLILTQNIDEDKIGRLDYTSDSIKVNLESHYELCISDEKNGWIVIQNELLCDKGYLLKIGEIVKFGKVIFRVKMIHINNTSNLPSENNIHKENKIENSEKNYNLSTVAINRNHLISLKLKKSNCRICLGDEYDYYNPLVSPCKCSGTMKHIHVLCLKNWLKSKIKTKISEFFAIYYITPLICELCLEQFPDEIKVKNFTYYSIDIEYPFNSNFLAFENLRNSRNERRFVYIIKFPDGKNFITLGRSFSCDVTFPELTVSKSHCQITLNKGKMYLHDSSSKFGTLIKIQCKIKLLPFQILPFQFKNIYFNLQIKRTFSSYLKCMCIRKQYKNYLEYFEKKQINMEDALYYRFEQKDNKESNSFKENEFESLNKNIIEDTRNDLVHIKILRNENNRSIINENIEITNSREIENFTIERKEPESSKIFLKKEENNIEQDQLLINQFVQNRIELYNLSG